MKILTLKLTNFKGIKELTVDFDGNDSSIFAANKIGKTTTADGYFYLLTDKDSENKKNFKIKKLVDGKESHNLNNEVEGTFSLGNGEKITFKKVHKEKYTQKRGRAKKVHTGHTTLHYIDGNKVSMAEYNKKVTEIAGAEGVFQLVADPMFFANMDWKKQEAIVIDICGDFSDEEVIAQDYELSEIPQLLDGMTADQYRKYAKEKLKDINKAISGIPDRIDEANRAIPDLEEEEPGPIVARLKKLTAAVDKKAEEISNLKNGGGVAEKRLQLTEFDGQIAKAKNEFESSARDEQLAADRKKLRLLGEKLEDQNAELSSLEKKLNSAEQEKEEAVSRINELGEEWKNTKALKIDQSSDICPTCNQQLPEDQIEEARAKFNNHKAEKIAEIEKEGAEAAEIKKQLEAKIAQLQAKIESGEKQQKKLVGQITTLQTAIDDTANNAPVWEKSPDYQTLMEQRAELEKEIVALQNDNNGPAIEAAQAEKESLEKEVKENQQKLSVIESSIKQRDRIKELEDEEKTLAAQYEKLDGHLYLLDKFELVRAEMMKSKIAPHFGDEVSFKLVEEQLNDGIRRTCEPTLNGRPYKTPLSKSEKIYTGLVIIDVLSKHYNFNPPVFVDNCESITEIPKINSQVIRLIVSPEDKALRVEAAA